MYRTKQKEKAKANIFMNSTYLLNVPIYYFFKLSSDTNEILPFIINENVVITMSSLNQCRYFC